MRTFIIGLVAAATVGGAFARESVGLQLLDTVLRASLEAKAPGNEPAKKGMSRQEALALYSAGQQKPGFDTCTGLFPANRPLPLSVVHAQYEPVALCSEGFATLYSPKSKTPLVVVERLTAQSVKAAQGEKRTDVFFPDPRLPASASASLGDYVERPGEPEYDRGHMAPAANAVNATAMAQTFALSNMVPQNPENNRGPWRKLESDTRKYASRAKGPVFVFTGPLFEPGALSTTGKGNVWVPSHLYKLVYDQASERAWAYVLPNGPASVQRPLDYPTFVRVTGLKLLEGHPVSASIH